MKTFFSRDTRDRVDIHCHILPKVDDGSQSLNESIDMLNAAKENGITDIVATPHVRSKDFDFEYTQEVFNLLKPCADDLSIGLHLGFEVNCEALVEFEFKNLDKICFRDSDSLLLEFRNFAIPPNWQAIIKRIQAEGLQVIIAHPERYDFIQRNINLADGLVDMGCRLQCDSFVFDLNRFDKQRKAAYRLIERGLVSWIGSDAHAPEHYEGFDAVYEDFERDLFRNSIYFD